jgi:oxygen-independent coproporphyrinogen-3 oxidase
MLERGELPLIRGLVMSRDDEIRRDAIHSLLCQSNLSFSDMSQCWGIDARQYFAEDLQALDGLQADGLVEVDEHEVRITPKGRFLSRVVAMRFDKYLRQGQPMARYSKVI